MNLIHKQTRHNLSSKLLGMNLMIVAAFIVLACVVIYIFYSIEDKAVKVTNQSIEGVINNSRATREMSILFSDIDFLKHSFYLDNDYLKSEGDRLAGIIENLTSRTANLDLKNSLLLLSGNFNSFLAQGTSVNSVLYTRISLDREAHLELTQLEILISEILIDATLAGKDTSFVTQQLTLVIGYRESLLAIAKLYAELGFKLQIDSFSETVSPVISAIDDLALRLQTITASLPEVALHGDKLEQIVQKYRQTVLDYREVMVELNKRRVILDNSKLLSLTTMEKIDTTVLSTATKTTASIKNIIFTYEVFVFILTIIVIIVLFITTTKLIKFNIKYPMLAILSGIESFSKGDFKNQITLNRNDEWGTISNAVNDMALALHQSYGERFKNLVMTSKSRLSNEPRNFPTQLKHFLKVN